MWALRGPTSVILPSLTPHQAAAGDAQHPHVERADIGLVAADLGVLHRRPAVPDDADIGAGAADLEVDAVAIAADASARPATDAAGPLSMVIAGRWRISCTSITPPSPRMIISGAAMPASRTLASVMSAVSIMRGRIEALITAVRVRVARP